MKLSRPEYWSGWPFPSPGIEPRYPALQADSLPVEPQEKPKNTGVGSLFLLQQIFSTQEWNWGLLHLRRILYPLSYKGSPNVNDPHYENILYSSETPKIVSIHSDLKTHLAVEPLLVFTKVWCIHVCMLAGSKGRAEMGCRWNTVTHRHSFCKTLLRSRS